ncbi:hypothetical protein A3715_18800 [Oleiphilus sp. HI0009]|nr:hypothetical protein A3715_18800 [Oleiphilus sp. HI0009]
MFWLNSMYNFKNSKPVVLDFRLEKKPPTIKEINEGKKFLKSFEKAEEDMNTLILSLVFGFSVGATSVFYMPITSLGAVLIALMIGLIAVSASAVLFEGSIKRFLISGARFSLKFQGLDEYDVKSLQCKWALSNMKHYLRDSEHHNDLKDLNDKNTEIRKYIENVSEQAVGRVLTKGESCFLHRHYEKCEEEDAKSALGLKKIV